MHEQDKASKKGLAVYNLDDFATPMLEGFVDAISKRVGGVERCA